MNRYQILKQEPTGRLREFWPTDTVFVVWDTVRNMRVPFGRYRDRESAQRRIQRMEER